MDMTGLERATTSLLAILPALVIGGSVLGAECVAPRYTVMHIPLRPPTAITDSGLIAGTSERHLAAVWSIKSGLHEIPLPAGFDNSEATAMNQKGHVSGMVNDHDKSKHQGFLFADDIFILLAGQQSRANDINDADEIVGESLVNGGTATVPVTWKTGALLPLAGCCGGAAKAVDNRGDIAGDAYDADGHYHAFVWTPAGKKVPIGPPDTYSSSIAINDLGHVVVQALPDVFLYSDEKLARLTLAPKAQSRPRAINNCDVIVGSFGPYDSARAFVWDKKGGFKDLNELISPHSGWKLEAAMGINNAGQIIGRGNFKGQQFNGFLLIPK